jgi:adenosylhomocysteine nucleosidase
MQDADFIELVMQGEEETALAALARDARLAAARNAQGVSAICLAVYRRRQRVAAALAAARTDTDVFEAACVGDLERVRALIAAQPNCIDAVSPDGFGPAGYAAFFGHVALLQELVRRGAAVNAASRNAMRVCPLHSAAATADQAKAVELARVVLAAGADPNARQQGGFTPLHEAVLNGNVELIALLLRHGADPHVTNDEQVSPIDLARRAQRSDLLALLAR